MAQQSCNSSNESELKIADTEGAMMAGPSGPSDLVDHDACGASRSMGARETQLDDSEHDKKPAARETGRGLRGRRRPQPVNVGTCTSRSPSAVAPTATSPPAIRPSLPGDTLAHAGDNQTLARPTTRVTPNKLANPSPCDYAPAAAAASTSAVLDADQASKQRANEKLPSSIRPGAYKEVPGKGLVRNNTLRFSIINSIHNKNKSLRNLFNSQRSKLSNSSRWSMEDEDRYAMQKHASARSLGSIPSVLAPDQDPYLRNVSFRSLDGGLSVARPVVQRESSTLEALCIIPGDLAVAVAVNSRRMETCHADKAPATTAPSRRVKARRMVASVVKGPIQVARLFKDAPKKLHLNPFRRRNRPKTRHPELSKLNGASARPVQRRHSFQL